MSTTQQVKIVKPDNHYFEIWQLRCGHSLREHTESTQWTRRNARVRAQLQAAARERMLAVNCYSCSTCEHPIHTSASVAPAQCKECKISAAVAARDSAASL